ncbi:battenin [Trichonephila clavipes]|nr:battenin [Trichonephila clavipes]
MNTLDDCLYQVDYQVGVLISRSSVNIFQCHKLWILPILQNHEDKEFSMGVASLGDSIGIALAGITALPVHDALCKLQSFSS